ncbi:hypothetical protein ES703_23150 [subsurface metagenome]
MAFIRRRGNRYYKVESYRDEMGRPRQRILARLGTRPPRGPHRGLRGSSQRDGNGAEGEGT